jgi:hypothetical protein
VRTPTKGVAIIAEWEAPVDAQVMWTSPKKGTLVTCVRKHPNEHLSYLLRHTGTLLSRENENTIRIQFGKEQILWNREHATYVTAREPECLWSITDISPNANNHIVAAATPIKRNNSKNDSRTIPINVARNLPKHQIEQMVANTNQTPADFPIDSKHFGLNRRNIKEYFLPENPSYNIPTGTPNTDESSAYLHINPESHKISKNTSYVVLAAAHMPTPQIGTMNVSHEHLGQPDKFVSNDEQVELLRHNVQGHKTNHDKRRRVDRRPQFGHKQNTEYAFIRQTTKDLDKERGGTEAH